MKAINTWNEFFASVPDFFTASHPIEAMRQAGFRFDGAVGEALKRVQPAHVIDAVTIERLARTYGQVPPVRVTVGRLPLAPPVALGFGAIGSLGMTVLTMY